MPIVQITMFTGRNEEIKARLSREVSCAVAEITENSIDDVHVIISEVSRDNWGRGLTLRSRRPEVTRPEPRRANFASVSRVTYEPSSESEYLRLRRDVINPGMATQSGFIDSLLLRPVDARNEYLLINRWTSKDEQHAYASSEVHDQLKAKALGILPRPLEISGAEIVHLDSDH